MPSKTDFDNGTAMDGGFSLKQRTKGYNSALEAKKDLEHDPSGLNNVNSIYHSRNLYLPSEVDYFHKRYRFGILNPYQALTNAREYLFFTKPDLGIFDRDDRSGVIKNPSSVEGLVDEIKDIPFWRELYRRYKDVIACLQSSYSGNGTTSDPFNHLLENTVQSNLDLPSIEAETVEAPTNIYGVGYKYRGSSEAADDNFSFSLEFKDTKNLSVYQFFKAYDEYETLKHHGAVKPWIQYIENKVLHDQYCIYKFLTDGDSDGETIFYYAKYYGVKSLSVPREVFNAVNYDNGISYSVNFDAAFVEDMNPEIIMDFNNLSYEYWKTLPYEISNYNHILDQADMRPAKSAIVVEESHNSNIAKVFGVYDGESVIKISDPYNHLHRNAPGQKVYRFRWRGDDKS